MALEAVNKEKFTVWENPTQHTIRFRIWKDASAHKFTQLQWANGTRPVKYEDIEIPPGGTAIIERIYDQAIQNVDRSGVIQSGLAPQLKKQGRSPVPMHPSLDPAQARKKEIEEKVGIASETATIVQTILQQKQQEAATVARNDDEELRQLEVDISKIDHPKTPLKK